MKIPVNQEITVTVDAEHIAESFAQMNSGDQGVVLEQFASKLRESCGDEALYDSQCHTIARWMPEPALDFIRRLAAHAENRP